MTTKEYRTREHGLDIDMRPARFPREAEYLAVLRAQSLDLLGDRWILHTANAIRRLPAKPSIIELGIAGARGGTH